MLPIPLSGLGSLLGWAFAASVAVGLGVGLANVATHYSRIWFATTPNTEFWLGLGVFVVGATPPLLMLLFAFARSTKS